MATLLMPGDTVPGPPLTSWLDQVSTFNSSVAVRRAWEPRRACTSVAQCIMITHRLEQLTVRGEAKIVRSALLLQAFVDV